MNNIELKIGDRLIEKTALSSKTNIVIVDRFTNTQAVLKDGRKIKIPFYDGSSAIGYSNNFYGRFYIITDELLEEHNKVNCLIEISKVNFTSFSYEKLSNILKVIKEG